MMGVCKFCSRLTKAKNLILDNDGKPICFKCHLEHKDRKCSKCD